MFGVDRSLGIFGTGGGGSVCWSVTFGGGFAIVLWSDVDLDGDMLFPDGPACELPAPLIYISASQCTSWYDI